MKTALLLLCLGLCSCSRDSDSGNSASTRLISTEETRQVAMHVLLNRYPNAEIVSEQNDGATWKYRFSTNGTVVPSVVVVDRKAAQAKFEKVNP